MLKTVTRAARQGQGQDQATGRSAPRLLNSCNDSLYEASCHRTCSRGRRDVCNVHLKAVAKDGEPKVRSRCNEDGTNHLF